MGVRQGGKLAHTKKAESRQHVAHVKMLSEVVSIAEHGFLQQLKCDRQESLGE